MKKQWNFQFAQTFTSMLLVSLTLVSCTKPRQAELPEDSQRQTFAIADFGQVKGMDSEFSIETDDSHLELSRTETVQALNSSGKVQVKSANVPKRLKYMFKNLQVSGPKSQKFPITFGVDRKNVTAYKVVRDFNQLSLLERQFAKAKEEVQLTYQISRSKDMNARRSTIATLKKLQDQNLSQQNRNQIYLVPIFKYAVQGYGILERTKNELKEETSTLRLRPTDWEVATHITISDIQDAATPVEVDQFEKENLERTFSLSHLQDKVYTAEELKVLFQVQLDMNKDAKVHTLLDDSGMSVFEIKKRSQLTATELAEFNKKGHSDSIEECSSNIKSQLSAEDAMDCITIHRFVVPVTYSKYKFVQASFRGEETSQLTSERTNYAQNAGLVRIEKYVEPKRVVADFIPSSTSALAVKDILNKEFFFRRTLQDAPLTTSFMPGEAGPLLTVRFQLEDNRLVVKRSDVVIKHQKGSNEIDREEILSIPAAYYRKETVDASGAKLAYARWVKTNKEKAEYVFLDWTNNQLADAYSPLTPYGGGQCITRVADQSIQNVDNRVAEGVINFTYSYAATLAPSEMCLGLYDSGNTYDLAGLKVQFNANLQERISFIVNDGRTDKAFGTNIPFNVQNALGYGVWTVGDLKPNENGSYGREGTAKFLNVKHDFRNGRQLVYTVTGLPEDDMNLRELYVETLSEVIASWNLAYSQAFKGTSLERTDRTYLKLVVPNRGENLATVGDLDKNIIHFENKFNDNHGVLGVTQVAYNPRSAIVVADSLIIYAGNLIKYVDSTRRNAQNYQNWQKKREAAHKQILEQLADEKKQAQAAAGAEQAAPKTAVEAAANIDATLENIATQVRVALKETQGTKLQAGKMLSAKNSNAFGRLNAKTKVKEKVATLKKDSREKFKYAPAQLEASFIERALRRVMDNKQSYELDIEGIVAEEMLKTEGRKLNQHQRARLQKRAALANVRNQIKARFKSQPGCALMTGDSLSSAFANESFDKALKKALYFDIAHEMGHSQGLTHNFAGSFDKTNFSRAGENSQRNYSSVMDYFSPDNFSWGGIGLYDIHALRATHTGLIEASQNADSIFAKVGLQTARNGENIDIGRLEQAVAKKGGWNTIPEQAFTLMVKPYKYCTDIHVGYEPTCQRFDQGTSATEIVQNMIAEFDQNYVNGFHAWDRLEFGYLEKSRALSYSMYQMFQMRQFVDEYFYKNYIERASEEVVADYRNAATLALNFYNNLMRAPTKGTNFLDEHRFSGKILKEEKPVLNKDGQPVVDAQGNAQTTKEESVIVFEYRALEDILAADNRLDTVGLIYPKIVALQMLTMIGYPHYKYDSINLNLSPLDLDFELAEGNLENMFTINTLTEAMIGQLQATHQMPDGRVIALGIPTETSDTLRLYSAIQGVLSLESPALRNEDNYANLFKVGMSLGKGPQDRVNVSALTGKDSSAVRTQYWALDDSTISQRLIEMLAIDKELSQFASPERAGAEVTALTATFAEMSTFEMMIEMSKNVKDKNEAKIMADAARSKLLAANQNLASQKSAFTKKLVAIAADNAAYKAAGLDSNKAVTELANALMKSLQDLTRLNVSTGFLMSFAPEAQQQAAVQQILNARQIFAERASTNPILSSLAVVMNSALQKMGQESQAKMQAASQANPALGAAEMAFLSVESRSLMAGAYVSGQLFSRNYYEATYATNLKVVDYLSKLTLMTNPELNR
ncbi:MAG: zinc-dependent metalloprotease [Bdellovibrionia bacterium]